MVGSVLGAKVAEVGAVLGAEIAEIGAEQVESAREHAEQGRDHDANERGGNGRIHGAALTLRIGRRPRVRQHGADWESGLRQRQDEPVELPLEPVDPRVRLAIICAKVAEVGAEQVERSANTPSSAAHKMPMSVAATAGSTTRT